jgi:hypothetical protein
MADQIVGQAKIPKNVRVAKESQDLFRASWIRFANAGETIDERSSIDAAAMRATEP